MLLLYVGSIFILISISVYSYRMDMIQASVLSKGQVRKASARARADVKPAAFDMQRDHIYGDNIYANNNRSKQKVLNQKKELFGSDGSSKGRAGREGNQGNASTVLSKPQNGFSAIHEFRLLKHDVSSFSHANTWRKVTLDFASGVLSYANKGGGASKSLKLDEMQGVDYVAGGSFQGLLTIRKRHNGALTLEGHDAEDLYSLLLPLVGEVPEYISNKVKESIGTIRQQPEDAEGIEDASRFITFFDWGNTLFPTQYWAVTRRTTQNDEWDRQVLSKVDEFGNSLIAMQPGRSIIVADEDEEGVADKIRQMKALNKRVFEDKSLILMSTRGLHLNKRAVFSLVMKAFAGHEFKFDVVYSYGDHPNDMIAAQSLVDFFGQASSWIGIKFAPCLRARDRGWDFLRQGLTDSFFQQHIMLIESLVAFPRLPTHSKFIIDKPATGRQYTQPQNVTFSIVNASQVCID